MQHLTSQQEEKFIPVTTDRQRLNKIIAQHSDTKKKIQKDKKAYYDEKEDQRIIKQYYQNIDFNHSNEELFQSLKQLLSETHTNHLEYDPSEYVYPWVDLRPDGNVASIYSRIKRQTEEVLKEDYETSLKRKEQMEKVPDDEQKERKLKQIEEDFKYNCEHAVPQSWFNERKPMRGDLHHLFTCEPACNSTRSNYPYYDFADYKPENQPEASCGKADEEMFEPAHAKGAAARAMLYFLIRYPDEIEKSHLEKVDTNILFNWHQKFLPSLYEKHRNLAIFNIQGNRNPFIDFPEKMKPLKTEMI
ncbi:endonuclease [Virgibacillus ihumii]|uniref:endonuclease n=1 Tax=Virgibacillus ihumii TaxID=2686091 RepID=UPI00157BE5B9|nr:endonuclease [Virgibacillus ihumii]